MNEPRWLDDDEADLWIRLLAIIELLPAALDAQLKRDSGMNRFEYNVMSMLSQSPDDTLPMSRLAFFTNGSQSRLSYAVSKLEAQGWVTRQHSATDRRSLLATLTPQGRALVERAAPGHVAEARRSFLDAVPVEKVRELADLLEPVTERLLGPDPDPDCVPPTRAHR